MQGAVNLGMILGADSVSEAIEPPRQFRPEGDALANRHAGVDRTEARNMLVANLPSDAPRLHQARLKASALLSEADEHRSGITGRALPKQDFPMPLRTDCPARRIYAVTPERERDDKKATLARILSVSERTICDLLSRMDKDAKEARNRRIFEMWMACATQEEIAEACDVASGTIGTMAIDFSI